MQNTRITQAFTPALLEKYDNIIFDCDGVIWHNYSYIDGIPDTIRQLQELGKNVFFCTNNSTKQRSFYTSKFSESPEFSNIQENQVYTSASTAASHMEFLPGFDKSSHKVLVLGSDGICQELRGRGFNIITSDEIVKDIKGFEDLKNTTLDPSIKAVVCGLDPTITYFKAAMASLVIRELDAVFISTNQDKTFPCSATRQLPAGGTVVAMIQTGCGKEAINMGKPTPHMMDAIFNEHKLDATRTLMVGDRLDTDIQFGNNYGVDTLLVFSGVTNKYTFLQQYSDYLPREDVAVTKQETAGGACPSVHDISMVPTYIGNSITCFINHDDEVIHDMHTYTSLSTSKFTQTANPLSQPTDARTQPDGITVPSGIF